MIVSLRHELVFFQSVNLSVPQRLVVFLLLCSLLSACATSGPNSIDALPPVDLSLAEARADLSAHLNQRIRWGGSIAGVENRANETWLEVVARPLDRAGRPRLDDESVGRFLVKVKGFLDPAVYANGRLVTVAGVISGALTRTIGKYSYNYVVVDADAVKLWKLAVAPRYYYPGPFYDPFYDPFFAMPMSPWYPWYPPYPLYPYWR